MDEQTFDLSDLAGIVRRRAKLVIAITGAMLLIAIVVAAVLPNQYEAASTLLVEPQTISKSLVEAGLEESDLNNRLHLMTMQILSRSRLSRIIDDLKLYPDLTGSMTREEIIQYMRDRIRVEPVLPTLAQPAANRKDLEINTFRLVFESETPRTAAAVANRLANDFIDEHIRDRVQVSGDTAEFIEAEVSRLQDRLRDVDAQIAKVKAENAGSLPEDMAANQRQLDRTIDDRRLAQWRLAEAESDYAFYKQQASSAVDPTDRASATGEVASPSLRLRMLEMDLSELRAKGFTDKHPDVIAAETEMEQLRKRIADEQSEGADDKPATALTAAQLSAQAEANRASLRAASAQEDLDRLSAAEDKIQKRLARTPLVAEQLDGLMNERRQLGQSLEDFAQKRQSAAVAANMERRQKGEQFRVLEAAFPPPEPISPDRPLIGVMGLLIGLVSGIGVALMLEMADTSYHDPRRLQQTLRIPVLASIPGILLDADRAAIRRRRIREAVAAAVVTGVMLTSAAAGYVIVNKPGFFSPAAAETPAAPAAPAAPAQQAG